MRDKKIVIVATSEFVFDQRLIRIAQSFYNKNFHVTLITQNKSNQKYDSLPYEFKLINTFFKRSFLFYAEYNLRIFIKMLFLKYDSIYTCDADTLLASSILKSIKGKKLIFDAHEYFEESPEIIGHTFTQWFWTQILKFGIKRADVCITVSKSLGKIYEEKYKKPFVIIRNLPYPTLPSNKVMDINNIIWYQGVLNVGRGLEHMIEAMIHLPEYRFYLAGDGDISSKLKKLVVDLNLTNRVLFLGKLSPSQLNIENQKAWIGINLLDHTSLNYYYSLANKTFDYIQAEIPAIHMSFPEYEDVMNQYHVGICIPDLNIPTIVNAVRFFESKDNYAATLHAIRKAKAELIWANEETKLLSLI